MRPAGAIAARPRVAVIGGGIQGCCAALELAERGAEVVLFERDAALLGRASLWNEGKIHLGYTYAKDRVDRTALTMARGALEFGPFVRRLLSSQELERALSTPFTYAVARGSMVDPLRVGAHLSSATQQATALMAANGADYLGRDAPAVRALSTKELEAAYDTSAVAAAYATDERALDTSVLCVSLAGAVEASGRIEVRCEHEVASIDSGADRLHVSTVRPDGSAARETAGHVVNASWDSLLFLDRTAGVPAPGRQHLWRHKVAIFTTASALAATPPCATLVVGELGDCVVFPNGRIYLSWYPAGRIGWSQELRPPAVRTIDPSIRTAIVRALGGFLPALRGVELLPEAAPLEGGEIFSWGSTDIRDPASEVHERQAIGVRSYGRYHSIDTGKLTMAPRFARLVAERIAADARARHPVPA